MNKHLVRLFGGMICLLVMTFIGILAYDDYLGKQEDLARPNDMGTYYYLDSGYFKIDPETILVSLESGDKNVFAPLLEDQRDIEALVDVAIYWTQEDFSRIASAVGRLVWNDPMDLKDWNVYSITLHGSCSDPIGFDSANITYFKTGRNNYTTRIIEIEPYFGWVRWGSGKTYPKPILRKWDRVDLFRSKITADDALRIASKDAKGRFQKEICGVLMGWPQDNDYKNWHLDILLGPLGHIVYIVNLDTGDYTVRNTSK